MMGGGLMTSDGGLAQITNSTFSLNTAQSQGAGISTEGISGELFGLGRVNISSSISADNLGDNNSDLFCIENQSSCTLVLA